jgi:hypothetical protein
MKTRRSLLLVSTLTALAVLVGQIDSPTARPVRADAPSSALPDLLDRDTVKRIDRGLKYLQRTQRHDGSWLNAGGWGSYPVVMTSLAGLAMMAGGSTPETGPYARNVNRALNFILNAAETQGKLPGDNILITAGGSESRSMYGHGFGMLFLAQCYGVEGDLASGRSKRIKAVLDGAVALTAGAQSDLGARHGHAGGWIYTPNGKSDEGSVTVTQLQALRACRNVGIKVPNKTIDRAVRYLKFCQQPDGGICYSHRSRGRSLPAISAAAIACFYSAGVYDLKSGGAGEEAKMVERLVQYCKKNVGPHYRGGHWFYTQFYMAQGMYHRGGKDWTGYFPEVRDRLGTMQLPDGNWNGDGIGEVYGTALACIILQLPYNYLPIMQR